MLVWQQLTGGMGSFPLPCQCLDAQVMEGCCDVGLFQSLYIDSEINDGLYHAATAVMLCQFA